jgi:uncharacterized membrane protein YfcA
VKRLAATHEHDLDATERTIPRRRLAAAHGGVLLGSVYGGYFGAGLGVVLLALLGTVLPDQLNHTNSLRAVLSLVVNAGAAAVFLVHGTIDWFDVALLAPTSIAGGYVGSRVARRLPPVAFRVLVIALGLATAIKLFVG